MVPGAVPKAVARAATPVLPLYAEITALFGEPDAPVPVRICKVFPI